MSEQTNTEPDGTAPKKVTIDDQTVEAHTLREQLDAADRKDANAVTAKRRLGIRFSRITPGDAL
jgi:hypothetical protein